MKLNVFQQEVKRTNPKLEEKFPCLDAELANSLHMALGMVTEWEELVDAVENIDKPNIGEELADGLWYAANEATNIGMDLDDYEFPKPQRATIGNAVIVVGKNACRYADLVKKQFAYGKVILERDKQEALIMYLNSVGHVAHYLRVDLEQAMQNVVDKLYIRFPVEKGFNEESANNRDLISERKELEK